MMSFLKTFGKGILYFLALPFLIVFLALYGFYLFGLFLIYFFKMIIKFFQGKSLNVKDELDEKAHSILKKKKQEAITKQLTPTPTTVTNNFINLDPTLINKVNEQAVETKNIVEQQVNQIDMTQPEEVNND